MFMIDNNVEGLLVRCITENKENMYRLAFSYVKNRDDALDIVQESIKKALQSYGRLKRTDALRSWLFRIVVNTSLDCLRKNKKVQLVDEETMEKYQPANDDVYHDLDLEKAMDNLPAMYRTVIILRYFEDMKLDEIAEVLKENSGTIKTRLYRALRLLRIDMNGSLQEEI